MNLIDRDVDGSMRTVILRDIIYHHKGPLQLWTYKTQRT